MLSSTRRTLAGANSLVSQLRQITVPAAATESTSTAASALSNLAEAVIPMDKIPEHILEPREAKFTFDQYKVPVDTDPFRKALASTIAKVNQAAQLEGSTKAEAIYSHLDSEDVEALVRLARQRL